MSSVGSVGGSGRVQLATYIGKGGTVNDAYVEGDTLHVDVIGRTELHSVAGLDLVRLFGKDVCDARKTCTGLSIAMAYEKIGSINSAKAVRKLADNYDIVIGRNIDVKG